MSEKKVHIVFNPASAGGRTGKNRNKILSELSRNLGNRIEVSETITKTDATEITSQAIADGCNLIIAVGGDGTVNQVINGILAAGSNKDPLTRIGIISAGTGQGFAQSIGLPGDLASQIRIITNDFAKYIDVGKLRFENIQSPKYFANEFQFGIGGTLCRNISPGTKNLLGKYAFGFEAVKTLLGYKAGEIQICTEEISITQNVIGVIIANGSCTGGGMKLTPNASLYDGLFDVLVIEDMPVSARLRGFSRIYSGKHTALPAFRLFRSEVIRFGNSNGLPAEADGELIFDKCISAEVIPSALRVISNN
jgi:YegS/Rv2252/BmrU family lipid kinase